MARDPARRTRKETAMPTATATPTRDAATTRPATVGVPRRLHLTTTGEPDTLPRVLIWLRRRGCELTRVDYVREDRHGPGRFVLAVVAPPRHDERLARGLEGLVGVIRVRPE
jgi:acetolactate synthase regulatory subunit